MLFKILIKLGLKNKQEESLKEKDEYFKNLKLKDMIKNYNYMENHYIKRIKNIRDNKNSIFKTGILGNGVLILAILASALLMVVILFIPQLRTIFSIPVLPSDNIIETIVLVLSPIVIVEIMKLFKVNTMRDE